MPIIKSLVDIDWCPPERFPRERSALVTDGSDLGPIVDEPSMEDFRAADEEEQQSEARSVLGRILRLVGVLLVIVALLLYFVVPFNNPFGSVPFRLRLPGTGPHTIPLAPGHGSPKLPT